MTAGGMAELIRALQDEGRTVIGPVVRDGTIAHAEISSAAELPAGWMAEQDGGRYQLVPSGTTEVFAYASPSTSWKRWLYPERTLLIRARRSGQVIDIEEPEPEVPRLAFLGVRSCDLAALGVLDRVLADPGATDPTYAARRADAFIVAAACNHPASTCFCASMGTGPTASSGYDLALRELVDEAGHRFLVDAGSERGAELLARLTTEEASAADLDLSSAANDRAISLMGRSLRPEDPPLAARDLDHPRWDEVAERCLACGNCTMVCPTCFCSRTEDSSDLAGSTSERWRVWDSCFTLDFSALHGGSARTSIKSRYRQWLLHKLVTWHDQFGTSGCVGCGRCITWCPVGIDLTEEVAALARSQRDRAVGGDPGRPAAGGGSP